jgi:hypothetical protein
LSESSVSSSALGESRSSIWALAMMAVRGY